MRYKKSVVFVISAVLMICAGTYQFTADETAAKSVKNDYDVGVQYNYNLESILTSNSFDKNTVYSQGLNEIEVIATDIAEFNYWQNADIVDFKWLHSFETGRITHALFEILGENEQHGYMIYDCEKEESSSFCSAESPYARVENSSVINSDISGNIYYFYSPMTYGCGILNDGGLIDIYEIFSLLNGEESNDDNVLYDVSFHTDEMIGMITSQDRIVVGNDDAVSDYEQRRTELDASYLSRDISYPNYYMISSVPDYQQSASCLCIPTSMANMKCTPCQGQF